MTERYGDFELLDDYYSNNQDQGERVIRALLLTGFITVLLVEAWLLWQWLQLMA